MVLFERKAWVGMHRFEGQIKIWSIVMTNDPLEFKNQKFVFLLVLGMQGKHYDFKSSLKH